MGRLPTEFKMTKAYEALVEFRQKHSTLYVRYSDGRPKWYDMKVSQLKAEYEWLRTIVGNRFGYPCGLTALEVSGAKRALLDVFQSIRGMAGAESDQFKSDLQNISYRYIEGIQSAIADHLGCDSQHEAVNDSLEPFEFGFSYEYPSKLYPRDDLATCEHSGWLYNTDDLYEVVTALDAHGRIRSSEMWGTEARDDHAFYCTVSGLHYKSDNFGEDSTNADETVCSEYMGARASNHDYTWSERRECWVYDNDWETGYHDWQEEEDEDEDSRLSDFMCGYHNAPKHRFRPRVELAARSLRGFFGYELEMHFDHFDDRESFMADVRGEGYDGDVVLFERDGSLGDENASVEVITAPLSLAEVQAPDGALARILELACERNGFVDEKCGTHITYNTHRFTRAHRDQMLRGFYALRPLSVFVARRSQPRYASFEKNNEKYAAINYRNDDLYEFRAFAGTLSHQYAASYAEYIEAIGEWVYDTSLPMFQTFYDKADPNTRAAFRAFVRSRSTKYPNLAARFCAPAPQLKETA